MTSKEIVVPEPSAVAHTEEGGDSLIRLALEQGHPVDVLERLVALQERVTERNARMAFVEALTAFRRECPVIPKTRKNLQFQKVTRAGTKAPAMYAALEDIDRIAQPVASAHGLIWTWDTVNGPERMAVTCKLLHVDGHSESATVEMPYSDNRGPSPQQQFSITQSYGMRYSLIAVLGITTADDDMDGNNAADDDGDTITEGQVADLYALADEVKANLPKFLKFLGVDGLSDLPASRYGEAKKALEAKRK